MLDAFTWFRQSAYRFEGEGLTVYIDPWVVEDGAPLADLILITHVHQDHFQPDLVQARSTDPMHYGFVVGSKEDGDRFRDEASPVPVEVMMPTNPFER